MNYAYAHIIHTFFSFSFLNQYFTWGTSKIAMLLGAKNDSQTQNYMKGILDFETEIANITAPSDERRDDEKLYHSLNITELQTLAPEVILLNQWILLNFTYIHAAYNNTINMGIIYSS